MAVISGKNGKIIAGGSTLLDCVNWQVTQEANTPEYASTDTGGAKASVDGVHRFTLTADVLVNTTALLEDALQVGDAVTVLGYLDATRFESYPARVQSIAKTIDINDGGEITQSVSFAPNGAWTYISTSVDS